MSFAYLRHKNSPRSTFLSLLVAVFSAALVSATEYHDCDVSTKTCDVEVNDNEALYKFTSRYSDGKKDRMWIFYGKAVPFATSNTHESAEYLDGWTKDNVEWESEDEYLVGWYSIYGGALVTDRVFKMRYRTLATGYTRGGCKWEPTSTGGWEDYNEHSGPDDTYVFGYKSDYKSNDRQTQFLFCTVIAPSPPPPPPSPPPGNHGAPAVTIGVKSLKVTSSEFDSKIKVADDGCSGYTSDCLGSSTAVTQSTAAGLHCDVVVADTSDPSCSLATAGDYLPCKRWDNFYDSSKADEYKFTLSTTDANNKLVGGEYDIKYQCYWRYADGTSVPNTNTGEQTLHTFVVDEGCSDWLPSLEVGLENSFLQSSPEYLTITDCATVDYVKETVFRKYDTNPRDGKLSYDELYNAFLTHDVDSSYMTKELTEDGYTELTLRDIMKSDFLPFPCYTAGVSDSDDVYVTKVTYTDSSTDADPESTTQDSCAAAKELVSVSWAYNKVPTHVSDYMCVYADRRLYEQHTGNLNTDAISLTDTRPSMGTGHSQVSLIAHFTFDDGILNSADPDDTATTPTSGYDSFEPCGDGVLCMKTSTDTTGYE